MKPSIRRQLIPVASLALSLLPVAGCSSHASEARRSMREGDPVQAVHLYRAAVTEDPYDRSLAEEFDAARRAASDRLAAQTRAAMENNNLSQAVELAAQASSLDSANRELEQTARHKRARQLILEAEQALAAGYFDSSRKLASSAADVAHDLNEPAALQARIDQQEAISLRASAGEMMNAGRFADARRHAERAASLQPGDENYVSLAQTVDHREREAAFDKLAQQASAGIIEGRLSAFWPLHARLVALDVRHDQLARLQEQFDQREQLFLDALTAARAAREAGDYQRAVGLYHAAESLVIDREDVRAERIAAETLQKAEQFKQSGTSLFEQGDYAAAAEVLRMSLDLRHDAIVETLYEQAEADLARQQYRQALDQGDRAKAIDQLHALLVLEPGDPLKKSLEPLHSQLADEALAESSRLFAEGRTEDVFAVLQRAMERVHDPRLDVQHARYKTEWLVQNAVKAEQAGNFSGARELYQNALAAASAEGNNNQFSRAAIEARISDMETLNDMQLRMRAAQAEAADLESSLHSASLRVQSREREMDDLEAEISRLNYSLRQVEYDLSREHSRNIALESQIHSLKSEIHRLEDRLRRARYDHNNSYSRGDDDSRRPRAE